LFAITTAHIPDPLGQKMLHGYSVNRSTINGWSADYSDPLCSHKRVRRSDVLPIPTISDTALFFVPRLNAPLEDAAQIETGPERELQAGTFRAQITTIKQEV
jgi:hypothetical protein